jgi:hypothetical protein
MTSNNAPRQLLLWLFVCMLIGSSEAESSCDLASAEAISFPERDLRVQNLSGGDRRLVSLRLKLRARALDQELRTGQAALDEALKYAESGYLPGSRGIRPLHMIFSPSSPPRSGYEQTLRALVASVTDPLPDEYENDPPRLKRYVGCVRARLKFAYENQAECLREVADALPKLKASEIEQKVRKAVAYKYSAEGTCRPSDGASIPGNIKPLSTTWNAQCLAIPNAPGTGQAYQPTVAQLLYDDGVHGEIGMCSGTLIAPNAVITAAHCFCDTAAKDASGVFYRTSVECRRGMYNRSGQILGALDPAFHSVFLQHAGKFGIREIILHPQFQWTGTLPNADLALLILDKDVKGIEPSLLNNVQKLPPVSPATVVGFGAHSSITPGGIVTNPYSLVEETGLKLEASVETSRCVGIESASDRICWSYREMPRGAYAGSTCRGDSGGPLFADHDGKTFLVGITNAGDSSCLPNTRAYNVDVYKHLKWIRSVLPQAVPEPALSSLVAPGDLNQRACTFCTFCDQEQEVTTPPNARRLVVSANCGSSGPHTKQSLQLIVKKADDETKICKKEVNGAVASCELTVDGNERWQVRFRATLLQQCQVVATTFRR